MAGPQQTRQIGHLCRIYKNSSDKVIAIDDVAVVADSRRIATNTFHQSSRPLHTRTLFYLGEGNRTVNKVLVIGDFDEIEESSGNYLSATWYGQTDTNNSVIDFKHLPKVGDVV